MLVDMSILAFEIWTRLVAVVFAVVNGGMGVDEELARFGRDLFAFIDTIWTGWHNFMGLLGAVLGLSVFYTMLPVLFHRRKGTRQHTAIDGDSSSSLGLEDDEAVETAWR